MKTRIQWPLMIGLFFAIMASSCQTEPKETSLSVVPDNPDEILNYLMEGNKRFQEDHPIHPDQSFDRLQSLNAGQHPIAAIISCSDSRIPPELVFDQGLGDLFVIRNAGNIISDHELGSIEYAVEHLETKLIIVLGHTSCGAIEAFLQHKHDSVPNHIQSIIDYIKAEPEEIALDENDPHYHDLAIEANIWHGVHVLQTSDPVLKTKIESGEVKVVGAIYDLHTGKVRLLKEE
jgi:carbonic anhydrase